MVKFLEKEVGKIMNAKKEEKKDDLYGWMDYLEDHGFKKVTNHASFPYTSEYYLFVHFIGDKNVGKKLLVRNYSNHHDEDYMSTLGITLLKKEVEFDERIISLMIGVLSPEDHFKELYSKTYIQGSNGAILMFDITDAKTLDKIPEWVQMIKKNATQSNAPILLVGNKLDLEERRAVSKKQIEALLQENHDITSAMEISLMTGENVEEMFRIIAILMFKSLERNV